jgi:hypothetical protein
MDKTYLKQEEILIEIKKYQKDNRDFTFDDFKNIIYANSKTVPTIARTIERSINRYINKIQKNYSQKIIIRKAGKTKIYRIKDAKQNVELRTSKEKKIREIINKNLTKSVNFLIKINNYASKKGSNNYILYPLETVEQTKEPYFRALQVVLSTNKKNEYVFKASSDKIKRFYFSRFKKFQPQHTLKSTCPIITKIMKEYDNYKKDDFDFIFQKKIELKTIRISCTHFFEMFLKNNYKQLYNRLSIDNRLIEINAFNKNGYLFTKEIEIRYIHIELLSQMLIGHLNHIKIINSKKAKHDLLKYMIENL